MKINTKILQITAAGALALATVNFAQAVPTLTMFDGTTTITITDGGAGDSSALAGSVVWVGAIGVFNINVNTGLTKPILGTSTAPHMDLNFSANATAAGSLSVTFSDDGFNYTGSLVDVFGGTAGNNSLVTDTVLKNGGAFINQGPFGTGGFTATTSAFVTLVPADVLSLRVNITTTGAGVSSGDKDVHSAPDNGLTVSLLGGAMVGLIALRRKLRSA